MLCLPSHTTHEAQPLDSTVFAPLKSQRRAVCHEFLQRNPGRVITKFNFNSLFSKVWLQSVIPANVIAGFKSCGVYPFNSAAIQSGNSSAAKEGEPSWSNGEVPPATKTSSTHTDLPMVANSPSGFRVEQQQLYKKRFNEGYNLLIDPRWLGLYHPEFCPSESVVSLFSDISPEEPVAVFDHTIASKLS